MTAFRRSQHGLVADSKTVAPVKTVVPAKTVALVQIPVARLARRALPENRS